MTDLPRIRLESVSYTYEGETHPAIRGISFAVSPGEWIWIVGPGGSGKSTICGLLCGIVQTWPGGSLRGKIRFDGRDLTRCSTKDLAGLVGAVFQDPVAGLIHDNVEDEVAFGPENLRVPPEDIERRIDEALSAVGLPNARKRRTNELSGGQKQRVAIASMLAMRPGLLVLDDAAAHLDAPAAARLTIALVELRRREHTIVTASSRLVGDCPADRVVVLERGRIVAEGPPADVRLRHEAELIRLGCLPPGAANPGLSEQDFPENAPDRRSFPASVREPVVQVRGLRFGYGRHRAAESSLVLDNLHLDLFAGDFLAVLGPNGSGKTTFGKLLAGLLPSPAGSIRIRGRDIGEHADRDLARIVGYVFQNPEHQFVADTVWEELMFGLNLKTGEAVDGGSGRRLDGERVREAESWLRKLGLYERRSRSPYDLSAAEKRLLAVASVLVANPDVIVLDEPTAGLDYAAADRLMALCADHARRGNAVVMITHDIDTVHRWATRELALERPDGMEWE